MYINIVTILLYTIDCIHIMYIDEHQGICINVGTYYEVTIAI